MSPELIEELRHTCETQFRYMLYKDLKYKFLPALGVKDIIQGFSDPQSKTFIGVLHLHWTKRKDEDGYYESTWYDKAQDALTLAEEIQDRKIVNEDMLISAAISYMRSVYGDPESHNVLLS